MLTEILKQGGTDVGFARAGTQPQPLGRARMHQIQDDIAQAVRDGQEREQAERSRKPTRRRWFLFLRRS
jgi:hypothetical protein